jgi:hypothetical protein
MDQKHSHGQNQVGEPAHRRFGLRPRVHAEPFTRETPRFHVFVIDTGWNGPVSRVLREHANLFCQYNPQDPVYILTREQSVQVLKNAPEHIGKDPMVVVYDIYAPKLSPNKDKPNYHGFRLNLGLIRHPEQALAKLQEFLKFVMLHRTADCLSCEVERELHREGLGNMVKLLREASEASLELL